MAIAEEADVALEETVAQVVARMVELTRNLTRTKVDARTPTVQRRETALSTPAAPLRRSRSRNCPSPRQQRLQWPAWDTPRRNQSGGDEDHSICPMKHEKFIGGLDNRCSSFLSAPVVVDRLADVCSSVIGGNRGTDGGEACARNRNSPWEAQMQAPFMVQGACKSSPSSNRRRSNSAGLRGCQLPNGVRVLWAADSEHKE